MRGAAVVALALVLALAAGACADETDTPPSGPTTGPAHSPSGTNTGSARPPSGTTAVPTHSPAALGEVVEVPVQTEAGVDATLRLTVKAIEVAESCPGRAEATEKPRFGYFLVLDVTAELVQAADGPADGYVPLGAESFRVMSPAGEIQTLSATDASWACFEDDELVPPFVDVGDSASGRIVLDSAIPHGVVLFVPNSSTPQPGWEF